MFRSVAQPVELLVVGSPAKRTRNCVHGFELACGAEHSPQHIEMLKELLRGSQIVRILQRRNTIEFLLLFCAQRF